MSSGARASIRSFSVFCLLQPLLPTDGNLRRNVEGLSIEAPPLRHQPPTPTPPPPPLVPSRAHQAERNASISASQPARRTPHNLAAGGGSPPPALLSCPPQQLPCRDKSRPASDTSALRPGREEKGGRREMQYSYENYKAGSDVTWHRGT